SSTRALRSLIGLLHTQAPGGFPVGFCRPAVGSAVPEKVSSALHRQAGQVLVLEAAAHGVGVVPVAEADETGAVEDLTALFEAFDIGAEIPQRADLAGGVGEHGAGAVLGGAGADLHDPAAGRGRLGHRAGMHQVDRLAGAAPDI